MSIENEVTEFMDTIKKGPLKEYFSELNVKENSDKEIPGKVYGEALYQGYLDACRTFKWPSESEVKKCKKDDERRDKIKNILNGEESKGVAYKIENYLEKGVPDRFSDFDKMHEDLCGSLIKNFSDKNVDVSYGQAQKLINMAFKYLYCIYYKFGKLEEHRALFDACHMPLDSFSLEWFKRYVSTTKDEKFWEERKFKKGSVGSWSSMKYENYEDNEGDKYGYETYVKYIRKYREKEGIVPLELDFIVWPKMQKIMAAEAFIKAFEEDDDNWVKNAIDDETYDIKSLDEILKKRLHKIRPLICDRTDSQVCQKK